MAPLPRTLQFRTPRHDDAEKLTALAHASKRSWNYPEAWIALWERSLTVTPEDIDRWQFEIAEVDGRIVGYYALSISGKAAELEHFWIAPGRHGQGYGRQLLQRALWRCGQLAVTRLQVVSDPNAETFYRKMGGIRIGDAPSVPAPRRLPVLELRIP